MGIGLSKGMTRDDAYIQGMHDTEERAALTMRTLAVRSGCCPGSWMRKEEQLSRPGRVDCPECGLSIGLDFDQDNQAFYRLHTINLRCRYCGSGYVEPTGKAMVKCEYCGAVGKGTPST